jgi:hypothetical protein
MERTVADVLEAHWHAALPDALFGVERLQVDLLILGVSHRQLDGLAELRVFVVGIGGFLCEG